MTLNIANTANNNTFDYWRNRTNELAFASTRYAVTVDSNTAVGNAAITGTFTSNVLVSNTASLNTNISVGNSSVNAFVNSSVISIGNVAVNTFANSTSLSTYTVYLGSNLTLSTSGLDIGNSVSNGVLTRQSLALRANSTVSTIVNTSVISITNTTGQAVLNPYNLTIGSSIIGNSSITTGAGGLVANTSAVTVGSNVIANTSALNITSTGFAYLANSFAINLSSTSSNLYANSSFLRISNTAGVSANLTNDSLNIGNSTVNSTIMTTGTGGLIANTSAVTVGSNVITNTSALSLSNGVVNTIINASTTTIGNSSVNSISNSSVLTIANSSTNTIVTSNRFEVGNGSFVTTVNTAGVFVNGTIVVNGNTTMVGNVTMGQADPSSVVEVLRNLNVRGNLVVNGSLTYTGTAIGDIVPNANNQFDIGNTSLYFRTLFVNSVSVSNSVSIDKSLTSNLSITVGNTVDNVVITPTTLNVDGFFSVNSTGAFVTGTRVINSASFTSGSNNVANTSGFYTNGIVNASSLTVGTDFTSNSTLVNAAAINVRNQINTATFYALTSVNVASVVQISSVGVNTTASVNALNITAGAGFVANSDLVTTNSISVANQISVGNSTVNAVVNSSSLRLANSTSNITIVVPTTTQVTQGNTYLAANGSWVQLPSPITTSTSNTTGTSAQIIDSYQMSIFNGAEYVIHVNDQTTVSSNARYIAKLLTTHDRTTGYITEYSAIYSNTQNTLGVFSATTNTSHVILQFTPNALITNTNVRFVRTIM